MSEEFAVFLLVYSALITLVLIWSYRIRMRFEQTIAQRNHQIEQHLFSLKSKDAIIQRLQEQQLHVQPRSESIELTEFLADFKTHGYSFVRVDPSGVMVRRPGAYV